MQVFISWSGEHSKQVASVLREWLPVVIQAIKPWFSTVDIDKGEAWLTSIQASLAESKGVGIFCLTPDNVSAPWLAFEAGALSIHDRGRVATFLHGVEPSAVKTPLSLFQATKAVDKEDVLSLLKSLNARLEAPLDHPLLLRSFNANWDELQKKLAEISVQPAKVIRPADSSADMLSEILNTVRRLERISADSEKNLDIGLGGLFSKGAAMAMDEEIHALRYSSADVNHLSEDQRNRLLAIWERALKRRTLMKDGTQENTAAPNRNIDLA